MVRVCDVVFSSSATVYGADPVPITEESPVGQGISNPYGRPKTKDGKIDMKNLDLTRMEKMEMKDIEGDRKSVV